MPNYAVESKKQPMIATGIVEEVKEWEDKPGGGRRPSDRQARDESTGMPLWAVEVLYPQSSFGRTSTVTAKVEVGAKECPAISSLAPVSFEGLAVEVRTSKSGALIESWSADAIAGEMRSAAKAA